MNLRLALYELVHQHQLDAPTTRRLFQIAGYEQEPAAVQAWLWKVVAVCAAALIGLGLILWLAANWDSLGRMGRFALLQGSVLVMGLGAAALPRLRVPLGLLTLLCIGGLFAYFGQTYQTGADPWQLFAVWALLALPLCLGARSDVLWASWALVVMTALALWTHAHTGHRWRTEPQDLTVYALAWLAALAVIAALSPAAARYSGAGVWALRTATTLTVMAVTLAALLALFRTTVAPHYPLALALFVLGAGALAWRRAFDVFALSAVALGLNTLLVAGLARWVFSGGSHEDPIARLFMVGVVAAGLLAASVSAITQLARHHDTHEEKPA